MEDLSEANIIENCPHCDIKSQAFNFRLSETENFHIVCDGHPLVEGHILIIPKAHLSCIGEYSNDLMEEFKNVYKKVFDFIAKEYGPVSTFEHGKIGQTVFHSHVHLMPFHGELTVIVPEGLSHLKDIDSLDDLKSAFEQDGQYLYFSIQDKMWLVDTSLGAPRFFRDRFAAAVGRPERGNWKTMHVDQEIMAAANQENIQCQEKWKTAQ